MFKKLRNRLVLINLGVTSIVIFIVFSAIYIFATNSANSRPFDSIPNYYSDNIKNVVMISLTNEKKAAADSLLSTLIGAGIALETIVFLVSYLLAEEAIKPVKDAYESQKIFIANASHEIKTPLAAISANLEAADIKNNKWIKNVEDETNKLTTLNGELLRLARTDLVSEVKIEEIEIGELTEKTIEGFEPRLKSKQLTRKILNHERIKLSKTDYVELVSILIDNAIKYSDRKIFISLDAREFMIKNDGAFIPEKDLPHVFDRFYQSDKSSEGVGLGLAIADSVSKRNNWKLSVESKKGETTFRLKI